MIYKKYIPAMPFLLMVIAFVFCYLNLKGIALILMGFSAGMATRLLYRRFKTGNW